MNDNISSTDNKVELDASNDINNSTCQNSSIFAQLDDDEYKTSESVNEEPPAIINEINRTAIKINGLNENIFLFNPVLVDQVTTIVNSIVRESEPEIVTSGNAEPYTVPQTNEPEPQINALTTVFDILFVVKL
ncbi:unnamed protein product [Adineta steineri]|uniref:Uncharacterized protein n=1 Tax=Adineta steineri TaxID=433720 RepID=A0A819XWM9_9BILA|nr:unnamed protein product [Adineta steineri]CAF4145796.1 unnamed protein product [Adineta steineri]